jgi:hypothetical protein
VTSQLVVIVTPRRQRRRTVVADRLLAQMESQSPSAKRSRQENPTARRGDQPHRRDPIIDQKKQRLSARVRAPFSGINNQYRNRRTKLGGSDTYRHSARPARRASPGTPPSLVRLRPSWKSGSPRGDGAGGSEGASSCYVARDDGVGRAREGWQGRIAVFGVAWRRASPCETIFRWAAKSAPNRAPVGTATRVHTRWSWRRFFTGHASSVRSIRLLRGRKTGRSHAARRLQMFTVH